MRMNVVPGKATTSSVSNIGGKSCKALPAPSAYISDNSCARCAGMHAPADHKTAPVRRPHTILSAFNDKVAPIVTSKSHVQENGARTRRRSSMSDKRSAGDFPSPAPEDPKPSDLSFFAENTTLHGVSHVFLKRTAKFRRALWFVAFFVSLGLFLHQAENRISYYNSRPHVTKLDEQDVGMMFFPAITICNMNSFRLSRITTDDYFRVGAPIFRILDENTMGFTDDFKAIKDRTGLGDIPDKLSPIIEQGRDYQPRKSSFDMFEFYQRTGQDLRGMVRKCSFQREECLKPRFWKEVYTRYGKCYTFNSETMDPPLNTSKGGVDNGVEFLLDVQQEEYMPVWAENDEISVEAGFKVQIHHQSEPPFIHELGFGVSPGFQTLVATQEQRITFLPDPWGDCIEKGKDMAQPFYYKNYSISACRISCETEYVIAHCGCKMVHMPGNSSVPVCNPGKYKSCADKALDFLLTQNVSTCACKTPCEVIRYNLESSTLKLPSKRAASYLAYRYNTTESYVRENFLKLNIFFEALNYETIDQKVAYEVAGLLGDIGGQMGLFIGASLLTILELFDYVYELFKGRLPCRRNRILRKHEVKRSRLGVLSSLLGKSEKNNVETMTSFDDPHFQPVSSALAHYPRQYRPQHHNGGDALVRHSGAHCTQHPHCINQSQSTPFSAMSYKTQPDIIDNYAAHSIRQSENALPPPPPEYLGQSMMTLRGDCALHDMHSTRRYNNSCIGRNKRETSLSYNDLLHVDDSDALDIEDDITYQHSSNNPYITTLPHYRAATQGFLPVSTNDHYNRNFQLDFTDEHTPRCASPSKVTYSKTLETDIH